MEAALPELIDVINLVQLENNYKIKPDGSSRMTMTKQHDDKFVVPVLRSEEELRIPWNTFQTVIGGRSIIDISELYVKNEKDARRFLQAYGFDLDNEDDLKTIQNIHKLALNYLSEELLPYEGITQVPPQYLNMPITDLLIAASASDTCEKCWPSWPCIILKLCHCATHALWTHDIEAHRAALRTIQERFAPYIFREYDRLWIGDSECSIPLVSFDVKENKAFTRTMTKLLHKPGNMAEHVYDRLGVRFVTFDIFSAILLVKFLSSRNIFMYANNVPEQSRNSLAELDEIHTMYQKVVPHLVTSKSMKDTEFDNIVSPAENPFTSRSFKVIKFVERVLVKLDSGRRTFFPYEIQIIDKNTWGHIQEGDSRHDAYEKRQLRKVQQRILGRRR